MNGVARGVASVVQVGLDRDDASIDWLTALRVACDTGEPLARVASGAPTVAFVTCHRCELYVEGLDALAAIDVFRAWAGHHPAAERVTVRAGAAAGRHLLRVVAGLESAVLGEDQVLAQARAAYRAACGARRSGPALHRLFHAAFRAGRRVRSQTGLAGGTRSLAGAAVAALHQRLGGLRGRTVVVLGAGEMAALAVRLLVGRDAGRVIVTNRTAAHASELARRHGAETAPWPWRAGLLASADGVIAATGASAPVLDADALGRAAASRVGRLVVVDLGVPRNVEAVKAPRIEVLDLDALAQQLRDSRESRAAAVRAAESIVEAELATWLAWCGARHERILTERPRHASAL